jgi:hypothetical protein
MERVCSCGSGEYPEWRYDGIGLPLERELVIGAGLRRKRSGGQRYWNFIHKQTLTNQ